MSNAILIFTSIATTIATVVIACATRATRDVYQRMSQQIDEQIGLIRGQFAESHKPVLSVSFKKCEYSDIRELFEGQITLANHGTLTAHQVKLRIEVSPL